MSPRKAGPMPAWLTDKLIADGHMTETHVTRKARPRRCRSCGASVLAAIDDLGLESWVDPQPLTTEGELLALVAGRHTVMVIGEEMCDRDAGKIAHRPADAVNVYAAHSCHSPPLPTKPIKAEPKLPADIPF